MRPSSRRWLHGSHCKASTSHRHRAALGRLRGRSGRPPAPGRRRLRSPGSRCKLRRKRRKRQRWPVRRAQRQSRPCRLRERPHWARRERRLRERRFQARHQPARWRRARLPKLRPKAARQRSRPLPSGDRGQLPSRRSPSPRLPSHHVRATAQRLQRLRDRSPALPRRAPCPPRQQARSTTRAQVPRPKSSCYATHDSHSGSRQRALSSSPSNTRVSIRAAS